MIERFIHTRRTRFILAASAILMGGVVFYHYLGTQGPSYKEVIVACSGLIVAVIIFGRELGVRYGFVLWVLTLMLGYRTVAITRELAIHPSEILLWLLLICILAQRNLVTSAKLRFPIWLWLFIPFWVLAWWPTITGGIPWDRMLNEFRNFLLIIPLMIVTPVVLKRDRYWRHLMLAFFVTGAIIALMGNLEYWLPEIAKRFPAFMTNAAPTITEEGFERAQFSFWGGPPATFICLLALPAGIVLMHWWPRRIHRILIGLGAVLQILGIYIGGYRSIWLILLLQLLTACVLRLRKQGAILAVLCLVIAIGGFELIPRTTERAISGISALQGTPTDSSATGRKRRAIGAVEITLDSPLGNENVTRRGSSVSMTAAMPDGVSASSQSASKSAMTWRRDP